MPDLLGLCALLLALALFCFAMCRERLVRIAPASLLTAAAGAPIIALGLVMGGCGGCGSNTQPNRRTASIIITAQSGAISRATAANVTVQ